LILELTYSLACCESISTASTLRWKSPPAAQHTSHTRRALVRVRVRASARARARARNRLRLRVSPTANPGPKPHAARLLVTGHLSLEAQQHRLEHDMVDSALPRALHGAWHGALHGAWHGEYNRAAHTLVVQHVAAWKRQASGWVAASSGERDSSIRLRCRASRGAAAATSAATVRV